MTLQLKKEYLSKRSEIEKRLAEFKDKKPEEYLDELLFCLLTPQSKAKKCWQAIQQLKNLKNVAKEQIRETLKTKTRFYNKKTDYIAEALQNWQNIIKMLNESKVPELRNWFGCNIKGLGLKESSHFLRNIGKSENKIAILDRHILRNLYQLNLINTPKISSKKDYLKKEKIFLAFASSLNIPADHLDLLFWSKETGEVFK